MLCLLFAVWPFKTVPIIESGYGRSRGVTHFSSQPVHCSKQTSQALWWGWGPFLIFFKGKSGKSLKNWEQPVYKFHPMRYATRHPFPFSLLLKISSMYIATSLCTSKMDGAEQSKRTVTHQGPGKLLLVMPANTLRIVDWYYHNLEATQISVQECSRHLQEKRYQIGVYYISIYIIYVCLCACFILNSYYLFI